MIEYRFFVVTNGFYEDENGSGPMANGWYYDTPEEPPTGPFESYEEAANDAEGCSDNPRENGY